MIFGQINKCWEVIQKNSSIFVLGGDLHVSSKSILNLVFLNILDMF